jgi:hypothetical protein
MDLPDNKGLQITLNLPCQASMQVDLRHPSPQYLLEHMQKPGHLVLHLTSSQIIRIRNKYRKAETWNLLGHSTPLPQFLRLLTIFGEEVGRNQAVLPCMLKVEMVTRELLQSCGKMPKRAK